MAPVSPTKPIAPAYLSVLEDEPMLSPDQVAALRQVEWALDVSTDRLQAIVARFLEEFRSGLSDEKTTLLPMLPSYLMSVPNGTETGVFLALDLGGTNLRVCEVTLNGDHTFEIHAQKYRVSESLKTGPVEALFDYIAKSVDDFLSQMGTSSSPDEQLHLGFTFSFPVLQSAIDHGTLIRWTKGFEATNAIGRDVVGLLQDALDRKHIHVRCSALVNDTVGTLLARGYQCGSALIGAIFGTGTNGAYVEKLDALTKMKLPSGPMSYNTMIINTEWGAFDNERRVLPVSIFDNKLDRESINPRKQAYEKMVSGMYLGEVARNVILHLIDLNVLFGGHSSIGLNTHYGLDTAVLSAIEARPQSPSAEARRQNTRQIIEQDFGIPAQVIADSDCVLIQRLCEVVGTRAARLSATAMAVVLTQTHAEPSDGNSIQIGVDGSVAEFYPYFETRLRQALREMCGESLERNVIIGLAKDGSGVGAALCALQAKKQEELRAQTRD